MRQIHLAGFLLASQVVHSHAVWRHPRTELGFLEPEYYQNIARVLERGKFDLVFFADSLTMPDTYGGSFTKRGLFRKKYAGETLRENLGINELLVSGQLLVVSCH